MKRALIALAFLAALSSTAQAQSNGAFIQYHFPGSASGGGGDLLDGTLCTDSNGFLVRTASGTCTIREIQAGTGTTVANPAGTAGDTTVSADLSTTPQYVTGTADRPAACGDTGDAVQIGSTYIETDEGRVDTCVAIDTWAAIAGTSTGTNTGDNAGYATVQDEDSGLTVRTILNFEGAGVSCADDTSKTTCTIAGGGSGFMVGNSMENDTVGASTTAYYGIATSTDGASAGVRSFIMPLGCTAEDLYIETNATQSATGSLVFTLYNATTAATTALTLTVAAGAGAGVFSDLTNTVALTAGSRYAIQVVNNATAASANLFAWGFKCS